MDKTSKINIKVLAEDLASKTLDKIGGKLNGTGQKALAFGKSAARVGATLGGIGVGAVAVANNFVKTASKAEDLGIFFESTFGDSKVAMEKLQKASQGTVSQIDLMAASNRASLLGVTNNVDDLASLMETARLRGKAMGLDTTQAFDDLVTGIGRGSPLILDNLGIKIPDALKESMDGMSEAEKQQTLLNYAITDGAALAKELGGDVRTTSDDYAEFNAKLEDAKVKMGEAFIPAANQIADVVLPKLSDAVDVLSDTVFWNLEESETFWDDYMDYLDSDANKSFGDSLAKMAIKIGGWVDIIATNLSDSEADFRSYYITIGRYAEGAAKKLDDSLAKSMKLDGIKYYENGKEVKLGSNNATGTNYFKGGLTSVNERGNEDMILPTGTKIIPHERSGRNNSNNTTVNINVNGGISDMNMINRLAGEVENILARNNKLASYNIQ